jgi:hypothetical protein
MGQYEHVWRMTTRADQRESSCPWTSGSVDAAGEPDRLLVRVQPRVLLLQGNLARWASRIPNPLRARRGPARSQGKSRPFTDASGDHSRASLPVRSAPRTVQPRF